MTEPTTARKKVENNSKPEKKETRCSNKEIIRRQTGAL